MKNLILFMFICCYHTAFSQATETKNNREITISGYISDSFMHYFTKDPYISFYDNYNHNFPEFQRVVPIKIVNNRFSVKIVPKGDVAYFSLGQHLVESISDDMLLIEPGDSIFMNVTNKKDVHFTGKGAAKMNFQHWAAKISTYPPKSGRTGSEPEIITGNKLLAAKALAIVMDSLNKCSEEWSARINNILRINTASAINYEYLNSITSSMAYCDSTYFGLLRNELNSIYSQQNEFLATDPFVLNNAFVYIKYLYALNGYYARLSNPKSAPFPVLYHNIENNYSGLIRDKLLPFCFLFTLKKNEEAIDFLPGALELVKDSTSRYIMQQVAKTKSPGVKAFDFTFEGLDGNPIKLQDFKGKVLIIDSWFNGCINCRILTEQMEPIVQHFADRKDVVFLSLNATDKDRNRFLDGVKSGKYGSKGSLFAWTYGLGAQHPMIIHYQYTGYPNLLIIGKDGTVISTNPSRPFDEPTRKSMISLIERNL